MVLFLSIIAGVLICAAFLVLANHIMTLSTYDSLKSDGTIIGGFVLSVVTIFLLIFICIGHYCCEASPTANKPTVAEECNVIEGVLISVEPIDHSFILKFENGDTTKLFSDMGGLVFPVGHPCKIKLNNRRWIISVERVKP